MCRLDKELDIVKLLKAVRTSKLMYTTSTTQRQRILMQVQRTAVLNSEEDKSSSENADTFSKLEHS